MNAKAESTGNRLDIVKWLVVIGIMGAGVYANMMYADVGIFYRALAGIAVVAVALVVAMQTDQGRAAWDLAKESRVEVRKVVWPSRQETTQTTLIVVVVVALVGLMLWGLDSGLSWGVQAVIG